jgi:hypothetical protein
MIWTTIACGFANNDTNEVFSAPSTTCDLGATRKSGGWIASASTTSNNSASSYHTAVRTAAQHVATHVQANASVEVLAAHSQSVAGVNRRVLVSVGGGTVIEARVHRNLTGHHSMLTEPIKHSCAANASCTAHPDCCTGGTAAACGACIATKMNAELLPVAQKHKDISDSGAPVGALVGGGIALAACIGAALVLWRKRAQQRDARELEVGAPAQSL